MPGFGRWVGLGLLLLVESNAFIPLQTQLLFHRAVRMIPGAMASQRFQICSLQRGRKEKQGAAGLRAILNEPSPPSDKFMKAVDGLGRRVTNADVSAATGLALSESQKQLSTLAQLTGATLEVSSEGTIVYVFDKGYRGTLSARSGRRRLQEAWGKVAPVAFYVTRVSFGIALIASIALVFTAIIALQSSSRSDDRDDRRSYG